MLHMARGASKKKAAPLRETGVRAETIDLADRLHSVAIHLLRRVRREDTASGIPAPQLSALSVIVFRGPLTLGALATAEQVRPPSMTRIVAALEADGLVERTVDPQDRRSALVRATPAGQEMLREGRLRRVQSLASDLDTLTSAERAAIDKAIVLLERIAGPRFWPVQPSE
jgi:DNA-binding MarR family transcriptional regulator